MKPHILHLLLICAAMTLLPHSDAFSQPKRGNGINTVVIDAGHGGKDAGCVRNGVLEKNINLKVALLLGDMISKNLPDVKVVYTRKTDVFVELHDRGNIANKANADLFISIHVDAIKGTTATGSSTYIMGVDKANANLDVAMRENDVVSYEDDFSVKYEGYVPGSAESYIIFSLIQYSFLEQSMDFANIVQRHYSKNTTIPNRGVKQAGFLVLWKTAMPSVLTEIGFMSHNGDRAFLSSEGGQQKIAMSLFNAFSEYKAKVEGNTAPVLLKGEVIVKTPEVQPAPDTAKTQQAEPAIEEEKQPQTTAAKGEVVYMIQVTASVKKISTTGTTFGKYKGKVTEKKIGNYYKYFVGSEKTYNKALTLQREVEKTFKGAFVVAMRDGEIVPITDRMKKQ